VIIIVFVELIFKELRKRVTLETSHQQSRLFEKLLNKPFWIWNKQQHKLEDIKTDGDCCFNHIIGLPTKEEKGEEEGSLIFCPWPYTDSKETKPLLKSGTIKHNSINIEGKSIRFLIFNFVLRSDK
jgi:hypothetical protein